MTGSPVLPLALPFADDDVVAVGGVADAVVASVAIARMMRAWWG